MSQLMGRVAGSVAFADTSVDAQQRSVLSQLPEPAPAHGALTPSQGKAAFPGVSN